jgi:hypothetical protein
VSLLARHVGTALDPLVIVSHWGGSLFIVIGTGKQLFLEQ